jgi:hypothetical protein
MDFALSIRMGLGNTDLTVSGSMDASGKDQLLGSIWNLRID